MLPAKMFFRSLSAAVLFVTGGFAAGAELPVPFDVARSEVVAPGSVADVLNTTPTTAPADVDGSTTTTTTPEAPPVVERVPVPVPLPVPTEPTDPADPIDPAPTTPAPTAPAAAAVGVPAPVAAGPAPTAPVDGDAPAVCAAAKAKVCGPGEPAAPTAADNSHAARVQRCQDWWNSLATAFEQNNRPQWAARAREIAGRCEAMVTRWQEAQPRWEESRRDRREKGDHNGDGHPDNGWRNKEDRADGDRRGGDADGRRVAKPAAAKADKISRHSEGRQ